MATSEPARLEKQASSFEIEISESEGIGEAIDRPTEELVIGMVGAVGAGVSTTSKVLRVRPHNQNMTVAARAMAERKTVGDLS